MSVGLVKRITSMKMKNGPNLVRSFWLAWDGDDRKSLHKCCLYLVAYFALLSYIPRKNQLQLSYCVRAT